MGGITGDCAKDGASAASDEGPKHEPGAASPAMADESASEEAGDGRYLLRTLHYDAFGSRLLPPTWAAKQIEGCTLDVRDGAQVVIPTGMHAGAKGEVDGTDREGNPRCRFRLKLKRGGPPNGFKAAHMMVLGTWWLQAAADGTVEQLPVVNVPAANDSSPAAQRLHGVCDAYG